MSHATAACILAQLQRERKCPMCRAAIDTVSPAFALRRLADEERGARSADAQVPTTMLMCIVGTNASCHALWYGEEW